MTRIAHSNSIPISVEYLGLNEWAVRWDVLNDDNKKIEYGMTDDDTVHYVYNEEVYYEKPNYGLFVTNRIREVYSKDEEDALKSNMITASVNPDDPKSQERLMEWEAFEQVRKEAKAFGKQIFIE